jgi:DNA-binding NarL/FixJ family response regulator
MHKVLVVDDLQALRQHVSKIILELAPRTTIIEGQTGKECLELARKLKPDMIVLDIVMPEMNGVKAAQEIWSENPSQKILFWSQFHSETYIREIGKIVPDDAIHGYALKTESDERLRHAVSCVLLDDVPYIDPVIKGIQQRLMHSEGGISDNEYDILVDLALGLTDRAIALREHISVRGAQNRIASLSDKLVKGLDDHLRESAGWEVMNSRARIVFEAFRAGHLVSSDANAYEKDVNDWFEKQFDLELNS